jgi:NAD(P)-dependent dehydrogenase (short-subunit alcohol dehydrogenase family)
LTGGRKGLDEFEGLSAGDVTGVRRTARNVPEPAARKAAAPENTHRYALRVVAAPRRAGMPKQPVLQGAALILGKNSTAEALAERIRSMGHRAVVVDTAEPVHNIEAELSALWNHTATPHLFLAMSFDDRSAGTVRLSVRSWANRRPAALEVPFRVCQLWMQKTIELGQMEDASVVAVTRLGGDFGFSGQQVESIEAIGGLVKAMLIESWMRGYRTTPMKVVDVEPGMPSDEIADGVMQELAVPSYDMEIALRSARGIQGPERYSVQAVPAPLGAPRTSSGSSAHSQITRGGTWIVSGGGRGITAVIAMTLAARYELKLHLLGTAPNPDLSEDIVRKAAADRSGFRRSIMQQAVERGANPVEAWRNMEKSLEIDATLTQCRERNIKAVYHSCDVSDFAAVDRILGEIRRNAGAIRGVIHGAGFGQDSRFDRKRPEKVDQCLRSKIDGCLALMAATNADPLEWFVAFGSISGRFGANGHTDYSLANDMMAKIVDRYRRQRSSVRSVTFHWHAWGDIGMATKPEARLALEMIDMEFMPATEGIAHFIREMEFGGNEPEVLITDESYFRKFFPADRVSSASEADAPSAQYPLIPSVDTEHSEDICSSVVTLNPVSDRFLSQHRVSDRPTLPFVVVLEMMAEAVRLRTGWSGRMVCTQACAFHAVRFSSDDPLAVTIQTRPGQNGALECRLVADVRRRDGRMVQEDREYFRAVFETAGGSQNSDGRTGSFVVPENLSWKRIQYAAADSIIYHGPELQELRQLADDGSLIYGRIAASAPVQLFGGNRARGFTVPCSTMDACLYAIGYAAWQRYRKPSLPVRFDRIEFGRLPDPGEPCLVRITGTDVNDAGATWDFQLQGHNGDRLLTVTGYRTGWLRAGS